MYDRNPALACSLREAERLGELPLGEVTPSRRDFAHYVSTDEGSVESIARLTSAQGETLSREDLVARACKCDDAEVAALALSLADGPLTGEDLAAVAAATTAPILRDDLCVDQAQIYHGRLHGVDAVVLPSGGVPGSLLNDLVAIVQSLHMAAVVEVTCADEIDTALRLAHGIVGVRSGAPHAGPDMNVLRPLLRELPEDRTVVVLDCIGSLQELHELRGICDAAVVPASLCASEAACTALQRLAGR